MLIQDVLALIFFFGDNLHFTTFLTLASQHALRAFRNFREVLTSRGHRPCIANQHAVKRQRNPELLSVSIEISQCFNLKGICLIPSLAFDNV